MYRFYYREEICVAGDSLLGCNLIVDLIPKIAELVFMKRTKEAIYGEQGMILLGVGLQKKDFKVVEIEIDQMKKEKGKSKENFNFGFDQNSVMGMFKKVVIKFTKFFTNKLEDDLMKDDPLMTQKDLMLNEDSKMKENIKEDLFEKDKNVKANEKKVKTEYYKDKFGNNKRKKSNNE